MAHVGGADRSWIIAGILHRRAAGWRRDYLVVYLVRAGKETKQASRALRERRHRRRGGAGIGEQQRGNRLVHPIAHLGIPGNASIAMIFAALLIHGIRPGPLLVAEKPEVFWGLVASMYIGNVMLLVLNLPLIGLWVRLLRVPYPLLAPLILVFVLIGAYSVNNSAFDVGTTVAFGAFGYLMRKCNFEP